MNDIPSYSLKQLAEQFSLEWRGDPEVQLSGIAPIEKAEAHHISFLENSRYQKYLSETRAGVVVLPRVLAEECRTNCLITDTPYLTYAKIAGLFLSRDLPSVGIHPTAIVDPSAHISSSVALGLMSLLDRMFIWMIM
ncbi:MAG: hypothetical protein LRY43_03530 [Gammaproteobacteria bacterium]|nr:hypothetical protein [Gammaproteobacteria bacterium]